MAAYRRVYDSRHLRLTAKNRDQLRNPTLGNLFTFLQSDVSPLFTQSRGIEILCAICTIASESGLYAHR